jgi:hypothetical protein
MLKRFIKFALGNMNRPVRDSLSPIFMGAATPDRTHSAFAIAENPKLQQPAGLLDERALKLNRATDVGIAGSTFTATTNDHTTRELLGMYVIGDRPMTERGVGSRRC